MVPAFNLSLAPGQFGTALNSRIVGRVIIPSSRFVPRVAPDRLELAERNFPLKQVRGIQRLGEKTLNNKTPTRVRSSMRPLLIWASIRGHAGLEMNSHCVDPRPLP